MTGLVDGMGGEEVNQAVTSTEIISGLNIYATSGIAAVVISGAEIYSAGAVTGSEVSNADGKLNMVVGGVVATAGGSEGTIEFPTNLPDTTYAVAFATSGSACSAVLPTVSGALNISGCEVIGDASTSYYFVATRY